VNEHHRKKTIMIRSSKYMNNLIEQEHRVIKSRTGPMLAFQSFDFACVTLARIELLHRIRKGQFILKRFGLEGKTMLEVWNAVLTTLEWRPHELTRGCSATIRSTG
jgi:transposase-like protein